MIDKISSLCVQKLLDEKVISFDTMEIYLLRFQLIFASLFKIISFLIIGLIFDVIFELFIFLIAFLSLRLNSGDFHANSYYKCFIINLGFALVGLKVSFIAFEHLDFSFLITVLAITLIFIYKYAPVEPLNKPLSKAEKNKYRKTSRFYVTLTSILLITLFFIKSEWTIYYYIFSMGFFFESLTLIKIPKSLNRI